MARPDINNLRSLGDFATGINWNISMIAWPQAAGIIELSNDDLNFRCRSTEVPMYDSQPTQIMIRGHVVRQPGLYTPTGSLTMQLVETVDNKVSSMLKSWREACWQSITGVQQTKADVEATLYLERLDRQDNPIWQYILYGVFLEQFDGTGIGQLGDMNADVIAPTLRVSYDYFLDQSMI